MNDLAPDQRLALSYGPSALREPFATLLKFDAMLGNAWVGVREPVLGQIRLAWWRDQLQTLPGGIDLRDPLLKDVDRLLCNHDVKSRQFVDLVNAWETLFAAESISDELFFAHAEARGICLFGLAAGVAGAHPKEEIDRAGTLWALVDGVRRSIGSLEAAFERAGVLKGSARHLPGTMRPFAILARFAERDLGGLAAEGSPRRITQALGLVLGFR